MGIKQVKDKGMFFNTKVNLGMALPLQCLMLFLNGLTGQGTINHFLNALMKIEVNIKARNPDWYYPGYQSDHYFEAFTCINEGKIPKHHLSHGFTFAHPIQRFEQLSTETYRFDFHSAEKPAVEPVLLEGLHITRFFDGQVDNQVVVSKEILHSFFAAEKQPDGKLYWYYYIDENAAFAIFRQNIWLSKIHFEQILAAVPELDISQIRTNF